MSLFGSKEKKELSKLKAMMSPEQQEFAILHTELEEFKNIADTEKKMLEEIQKEVEASKIILSELQQSIFKAETDIVSQGFGIYPPAYSFNIPEEYLNNLTTTRERQKRLISTGKAILGKTDWEINGSVIQGRKLISDLQGLLLRAFNIECNDVIAGITADNIKDCEGRIADSRDAISKLGRTLGIQISTEYYTLKIEELYLMYECRTAEQ